MRKCFVCLNVNSEWKNLSHLTRHFFSTLALKLNNKTIDSTALNFVAAFKAAANIQSVARLILDGTTDLKGTLDLLVVWQPYYALGFFSVIFQNTAFFLWKTNTHTICGNIT